MIKAVIFDLDDTLYPEDKFVESGFNAVSKYISNRYGLDCKKIIAILKRDFKNGIKKNNFDILLKKLHLDAKDLKILVGIYKHHKPLISLYPDAERFLDKKAREIKLGLITNGDKVSQKNKISVLKIKKYFSAIIISTTFGDDDWKSSKKSFNYLLKSIKVRPSETVYVGDNPRRDFAGAKKLGIFTVRIKRKDGIYNQLKANNENKSDSIISNLKDIENLCQIRK